MYFEIYKKGKLIKRGNELLNNPSWTNELMTTPTTSISLPIDYLEYLSGREHIKLFLNNKCFWGIVKDITVNKVNETIDLSLSHHIDEWNNRQISINNAISDKELNIIYKPDSSGAIKIRNIENNQEMVGVKLTLKYSDFKGKSLSYINNYISNNASVIAFNMEDVSITYPVHFVSSTITLQRLKTNRNVKTAVQGTYYATFKTDEGTQITIPVTVSYAAHESGSQGDASVDAGSPSVEDSVTNILNDDNFIYYEWWMDIESDIADTKISYVYSKQSKYEALNKTMELTDDLFWRVHFENNKDIHIGRFGEQKPYTLSVKKPGKTNIQILEEPNVDYDFDNVINVATVISEKSDSGASATTLRDLYNMQHDTLLQAEYPEVWSELSRLIVEFPIVIIRDSLYTPVNNERNYNTGIGLDYNVDIFTNQSPLVAPNTSREYAIIDTTSVAMESGTIVEGSYSFNDLAPVTQIESIDEATQKIDNKERLNAELIVYKSAIKKLKQCRRTYSASMLVSELPSDINVGDKIRLIYSNKIWHLDACSNYFNKIVQSNDWYYITKIDYNFDGKKETDRITISKFLKIQRETQNGY